MVLFALFAHRGPPWVAASGAGLLAAAVLIGHSLRTAPWPPPWAAGRGTRVAVLALLGIAIGVAAGLLQRHQPGVLPEPASGVHRFVALACLIGATEELVYRGWMLEQLSTLGPAAAVVITSVAHAAYKTALFAWPPGAYGSGLGLGRIALWTVIGGVVLGLLRVRSRSALPPVLAHVAFDAVVYSAFAAPPWWVWG